MSPSTQIGLFAAPIMVIAFVMGYGKFSNYRFGNLAPERLRFLVGFSLALMILGYAMIWGLPLLASS
jgi:hypothetical protein